MDNDVWKKYDALTPEEKHVVVRNTIFTRADGSNARFLTNRELYELSQSNHAYTQKFRAMRIEKGMQWSLADGQSPADEDEAEYRKREDIGLKVSAEIMARDLWNNSKTDIDPLLVDPDYRRETVTKEKNDV